MGKQTTISKMETVVKESELEKAATTEDFSAVQSEGNCCIFCNSSKDTHIA